MRKLALLFLLFVSPAFAHNNKSEVLTQSVYSVEFNHFYDDAGRHVFDQIIFYRSPHEVMYWQLVKDGRDTPTPGVYAPRLAQYMKDLEKNKTEFNSVHELDDYLGIPWEGSSNFAVHKNYSTGKHVFHCILQNETTVRKITADNVIHTWTQTDPELIEREYFLPKEHRRGFQPELKIKIKKEVKP